MPIETATYIADLDANNPDGTVDTKSTLDNHDRLIKSCLKATLPGFAGRFRRIQSKTGAYTAVLNDNASVLRTSNSWTLSLTAAATLGNGWELYVYNDGSGTITADPNGAETINGAATLAITAGRICRIWCDGSAFFASIISTGDQFPSGTLMLFQQTSAPTGWTKQTTHNDKALRVVSGAASSGGATAFTSVFGSGKNTGSYALQIADMPPHTHGAGSYVATAKQPTGAGSPGDWAFSDSGNNTASVPVSGTSGATGGGGGHSHTQSLDLQYVDVIIASKD